MKKIDAVISPIIGFFIGVFFFVALKIFQIEIPASWLLFIIFPPLTFLGLFIASFLGKRIFAIYQMAKFVLVGALNTFVDLGILNLLMWFSGVYTGIFFSIFKGISFLAAATNSYLWNKHWTFEKRENVFSAGEYLHFLIIVTIGFFINVAVASFVVNSIGPRFGVEDKLWANVGAFAAVFVAWVWNFLGVKFIVFKK